MKCWRILNELTIASDDDLSFEIVKSAQPANVIIISGAQKSWGNSSWIAWMTNPLDSDLNFDLED